MSALGRNDSMEARVTTEYTSPVKTETGPLYILGKCINRSQSGHEAGAGHTRAQTHVAFLKSTANTSW